MWKKHKFKRCPRLDALLSVSDWIVSCYYYGRPISLSLDQMISQDRDRICGSVGLWNYWCPFLHHLVPSALTHQHSIQHTWIHVATATNTDMSTRVVLSVWTWSLMIKRNTDSDKGSLIRILFRWKRGMLVRTVSSSKMLPGLILALGAVSMSGLPVVLCRWALDPNYKDPDTE